MKRSELADVKRPLVRLLVEELVSADGFEASAKWQDYDY